MATLLGPDGRPIDMSVLKQEVATPTLSGVRTPMSDHPSVGLTPQRLANILREAEEGDPISYFELAEEMEEKDLHYLSVMGTRKRAVSQLEITVEPAGESAEDKKNTDLVQEFISRECLEDELFDILDAVGKGFSNTEIIWDVSERQWMPKRLQWVDPRWFELDRVNRRTLYLRSENGPQPLPPYKFLYHEAKAKSGLPIRGGIARAAAWAYLFKNFDIKSWVIFAEVYGQPIRVGKYHPGATPEDRATLLRAVANIGTDAAAIIPNNMLVEFIEAGKTSAADFHERLAKFLEQQISKAVLGQTTTTDAISGGHAVSKEHNEVRGDIEQADAKQVAATLNAQLVRPLIDLNHGPQKRYPRIRIGRAESTDIGTYTEAVDKMARLGLSISKSEVMGRLGWKPPADESDILTVTPSLAPALTPALASTLASHAQRRDDDSIDRLTETMLDDWEEVMAPVVGPLRDLVESASSFEDLRERLAGALNRMDSAAMQDLLARAGFNARLAGNTDAAIRDDE